MGGGAGRLPGGGAGITPGLGGGVGTGGGPGGAIPGLGKCTAPFSRSFEGNQSAGCTYETVFLMYSWKTINISTADILLCIKH